MAQSICKSCGAEAGARASRCPACNVSLISKREVFFGLVVWGLLGAGAYYGNTYLGQLLPAPKATPVAVRAPAAAPKPAVAVKPVPEVKAVVPAGIDEQRLLASRAELLNIENDYFDAQEKFAAISRALTSAAQSGQAVDTAQANASMRQYLVAMNAAVNRSQHLQVPALANAKASQALAQAIGVNKRWSLLEQMKIDAIMSGKYDMAPKLESQAQRLTTEESTDLLAAYQALGVGASSGG